MVQKKKDEMKKKKIKRMNEVSVNSVLEFIAKKREVGNHDFVTDPAERDEITEKKIHKFLLKRQGIEYNQVYKDVAAKPKEFIDQTLNSSISSFKDLTYYGEFLYKDKAPDDEYNKPRIKETKLERAAS